MIPEAGRQKHKWLYAIRNMPVVVWLLVGIGLAAGAPVSAQSSLQTITHVEMILADQSGLPGDAAPWMPFELPYRLITDEPDNSFAWFRVPLPPIHSDVPLSLYLSNYMYSLEVYLNGVRIGGTS